jgi:hypothetical protein
MAGEPMWDDGDGDNVANALRPMPGHHSSFYNKDLEMKDHRPPTKVHNGPGNRPLPTKHK